MRLKITYVLKCIGRGGGCRVVLEHVARLAARGWPAEVWHMTGSAEWFGRPVPCRRFSDPIELCGVRGIKVATWWETAPWVARSLAPGDRGYYLVQDLDEETYEGRESSSTYGLGLRPIVEGRWVERQLRERYCVSPAWVGIGIDCETFRANGAARDTHRIFAQARPRSGGPADLKGWGLTHEVMRGVARANHLTSAITFGVERMRSLRFLPHRHMRGPTDSDLSAAYASSGVYLMTSRHEGFGLTAAEAMACGTPIVCTRAEGNEEFCLHGTTALVAAKHDVDSLVQYCLQAQHGECAELAARARDLIRGSYRWDPVIDRLEEIFA